MPACSSPSTSTTSTELFSAVLGYANFAIDDPALKLVLIENPGFGGSLNHLGVEVTSTAEVIAATRRLAAAGLPTQVEEGTTCCYAPQDKVWATGPGGERWEVYTVLAKPAGSWRAPRQRRFRPRRRDQQPRSHRRIAPTVGRRRRLNGQVQPTPQEARP